MLRVMLVDDEPLALEGLALLIDWKKEGFTVCASCQSGQAALDALAAARPHLIVTDIRMQGMDGLALMAAARERGYEGAFIVVSGYSDFEYAKRAMRIGVAGYLLKPVEPREASEVLEHVRRELIDRELRHRLPLAASQQAVTSLLMGQPAGIKKLPIGAWQLFTWGMPLPYEVVTNILEGFSDTGIQATTHIVEGKEWLVLFDKDTLEKAPADTLRRALHKNRRDYLAGPVTGTAEELADVRRDMCARLDDCGAELLRRTQELAHAVSLLQHEEFAHLADELEDFCQLRGSAVKARALELFHALCAQQLSQDAQRLGILPGGPDRDVKALGELTMRLLTPSPKRISDQVKEYVLKMHGQRLTLEGVASVLGYNATYLGRVIREETGMGFRGHLTSVRMQKASELLASSPMPVHLVAQAVGYPEYKQFLAHFRQQYGQTPKEYRRKMARP